MTDFEETAFVKELMCSSNCYLHLVRGRDRGLPAYHHVLVDPESIPDFLHDASTGGSMDVANYGTSVQSGLGIPPNDGVDCTKALKDLMIFTGFSDEFDGAWYYLQVENAENVEKQAIKGILNSLLRENSQISNLLPPHLKILHSGWGRDPPESIAHLMLATHFDIRDGNGLENQEQDPFLRRLHRDARYRQSELFTIAKFQDAGIDLSQTEYDKNDWTILHHAAFGGDSGIVQFLIDNGADIYAIDSICGRKPIHIAAREGFAAVLELFLRSGVSFDVADKNGMTPLHYAAWAGHKETVNLLIIEGADINARDNVQGIMPIHLGAREGHIEIVKSFLVGGIFVDETDQYGRTPLYFAAFSGQLAIVKYLVDNGANMDAETNDRLFHKKPIHVAAGNDRTDVIEFFLNKHQSIDHPCREDSWTPLHHAAVYGLEETVRFLLMKGANIEAECQY